MKVAFIIYEALRFLAILISKPEYSVQALPLSWYAAVPLAFLPVILAYMTFKKGKNVESEEINEDNNIPFLYIISKILMIPGFIAYIINGRGNYSLQYLLGIVLFLLIDVILIIIFTIIIKKNQIHDKGNTE